MTVSENERTALSDRLMAPRGHVRQATRAEAETVLAARDAHRLIPFVRDVHHIVAVVRNAAEVRKALRTASSRSQLSGKIR